MTGGRRIAVLGEALVDILQDATASPRAVPGGSGLNTALALARLDAPTVFCGALSEDAEGAGLARFLASEGVDLSFSLKSARPCTTVLATPGADGSPTYDLRLAGSALDEAPGAWRLPQDVLHVHATSFASTAGAQGAAALETLLRARPLASTSYDPNVRLSALPPLPEARALIAARVAQADVVKASAEDLAQLGDPDGLLREWRGLGPKLIVVTRGPMGAIALFEGGEAQAEAPVVRVRDTIGAGDAFMAALLAQMRREGALGPEIGGFEAPRVAAWLSFAARAAALCCMREGCDPPRGAALEARQ